MEKELETALSRLETNLNDAIATRRVGTIRVALVQIKVIRKMLETTAPAPSKKKVTNEISIPVGEFLHTDNPGFGKRVQKLLSAKVR